MAGYIRQSTFVDGDTITAALFNNEYNQLVNAFSNTSGHKHDGTTAEGPVIGLIGDAGETSPNNKVLIDTTNNYIEFYVEVSSAPVQQLYIADGAIIPVTDSDIDLGTTSLRFKDTYTDTVTTTGNVSIGGNLTVTGNATISGNLTFGDADTDSINLAAEIDSHIVPNTDNTYDLGTATKEWRNLYIDGTANIDSLVADTADINGGTIDGATIATSDITVGAGKTLNVSAGTLTLADNQISGDKVEGGTIAATTITTLTSTTGNITNVNATTLDTTNIEVTNLKAKDGTSAGSIADSTGVVTLASSVLTTTDINGGTIDGVTIGGTTAGAVTFTDLSDGTITIAGFADEDNMSSDSATLIPTQQSVKAYVDSQVTAQDLDFQGDTGGALSIDLDSESLTIAGGTGIDTSGATNTLTVAIDSTVATLTGTQTLTNKTLTSPDVNTPDIDGGTIDSTIIGGTTPAAGTFTTLTANTSITGTLATAAQPNITSLGTLTGLDVAGTPTFDGLDVDGSGDISGNTYVNSGNGTGTALKVGGESGAGIKTQYVFSGSTQHNWQLGFATHASQVMSITPSSAAGNTTFTTPILNLDGANSRVGIGTTSPQAPLHARNGSSGVSSYTAGTRAIIEGTATTYLTIASPTSSNKGILFADSDDSDAGFITYDPTDNLDFGTAGSTRLRIDSSGNVGIGTTSAKEKLDVSGAAVFTGSHATGTNAYGAAQGVMIHATSSTGFVTAVSNGANDVDLQLRGLNGGNANANQLVLDSSGNVGIGNSSPTRNLTVGDTAASSAINIKSSATNGYSILALGDSGDDNYAQIFLDNATNKLQIQNGGGGVLGNRGITLDSSENVGIGESSPQGILHVKSGDSGATADSGANELVVEGSGNTGISILSGASSSGAIYFGDSGLAYDGYIAYSQTDRKFNFATAGSVRASIDSSGNVGIGESSPENILHIKKNASGSSYAADGGDLVIIENNSSAGIDLRTPTGDAGAIYFSDTTRARGAIIYYHSLDDMYFNVAGTSGAMVLNSSGNVGIGTTSPSRRLHLYHPANDSNFLQFTNTTTGETGSNGFLVGIGAAGNAELWNYEAQPIIFGTSSSERMRIDSSGSLNIGVSSAISSSTNTADGFTFYPNSGYAWLSVSDTGGIYVQRQNDNSIFSFYRAASNVGSISVTSSATSYNTSSDARLKDVTGEARGLEVINELNPVSYNWKADGKADEGLIAQEVMDIVPNAVSGSEEDMYQMDYSKLVVHLVAGMKEQQAQIEALQSEINLLKGE